MCCSHSDADGDRQAPSIIKLDRFTADSLANSVRNQSSMKNGTSGEQKRKFLSSNPSEKVADPQTSCDAAHEFD